MVPAVSALLALALAGLALSLAARWQGGLGALARWPSLDFDALCLALAAHLGVVGLLATLLAWAGLFSAGSLALACALTAAAVWPWRSPPPDDAEPPAPSSTRERLVLAATLAVLAVGVGLRSPSIRAPLAGRDQGTYVLRAQLTLRTGALGWTDRALAEAAQARESHPDAPGPRDILGLYPRHEEPWRQGNYESPYRPGAYLAERDAGRVVPQFFHLHPTLLAVAGAVAGPGRTGWMMIWIGALGLSCFACVARRLWPARDGPWSVLALALLAASPLAIWTARTPLSEGAMALFEVAALLAALRLRDAGDETREPWRIALFLGFAAFVRGNALIVLPVILAATWLRPRDQDTSRAWAWSPALVLAALLGTVVLHALTTYPYLHDELLRRVAERVPGLEPTPAALMGLTAAGAALWVILDRAFARLPEGARAALVRISVPAMVLGTFAAFGLWAALRAGAPDLSVRPFSRLDAAPILIGAPMLVAAGLGLVVLAWTWRPTPRAVWLVALASLVPVTALLYAPRELPTLGFFYYGRYLVPELLPAAILASTAALAAVHGWIHPRRPRLAHGLVGALALGLVGVVATPLVRSPQLRLREYEPASAAVDWLAARIPEDAVLIAGGEGWHHDHTHNQIGGALALARGAQVLPYRTREDAWVTAWELLVAGPERSGEPPPPVYLLVNEAAHQTTRKSDGARLAVVDDQLWSPFRAERVELLELFVDALTPVGDQLPTRVARHELRMALIRLEVDADALARIERVRFEGDTCLRADADLELRFEADPARHRHLALSVAGLGDSRLARALPQMHIEVDGQRLRAEPPKGVRGRHRATLGPLPLPLPDPPGEGPRTLRLRMPELEPGLLVDDPACPYGRVDELRLLPRERGALDRLAALEDGVTAVSIAPRDDLGHPPKPATWVRGRSLSRYRAGTEPEPEIRGRSMVIAAGEALDFAAFDLPLDGAGAPHPLLVLVTLTRTSTGEGAQLVLEERSAEGEPTSLATLDIPAQRPRTFIADPLAWRPTNERARIRVRVVDPNGAGGEVELRDVALFVDTPGIPSALERH